MAFITDEELLGWVRVSDPTAEGLLPKLAARACSAVESWCVRRFTPGTVTELAHGSGSNILTLREWPVVSVTSVQLDNTMLAASDYKLVSERELQRVLSIWPRGRGNLRVVYEISGPPEDVKIAALITAQAIINSRSADPNVVGESAGGYSSSYWGGGPGSIPPAAQTILRPHRSVFRP